MPTLSFKRRTKIADSERPNSFSVYYPGDMVETDRDTADYLLANDRGIEEVIITPDNEPAIADKEPDNKPENEMGLENASKNPDARKGPAVAMETASRGNPPENAAKPKAGGKPTPKTPPKDE